MLGFRVRGLADVYYPQIRGWGPRVRVWGSGLGVYRVSTIYNSTRAFLQPSCSRGRVPNGTCTCTCTELAEATMLVYPAGSIDCDEATEARARISWVTTIQHAYRDVVSLCVCVLYVCMAANRWS